MYWTAHSRLALLFQGFKNIYSPYDGYEYSDTFRVGTALFVILSDQVEKAQFITWFNISSVRKECNQF